MPLTDAARYRLAPADLERLVTDVQPYTMVPRAALRELAAQVAAVLAAGLPGDFVECGVWRGGSAFLMASVLRHFGVTGRKVWLCDSFQGLPPPDAVDGTAARSFAEGTLSSRERDNCRAELADVRAAAEALQLVLYVEFVEGWFDRTLPALRRRVDAIALLRIDADWHASVRCCLDNLYDAVVPGGLVVVDDYYSWEGCAVAVHEFLAARRLPHRIETVVGDDDAWDGNQVAVFAKGGTWRLMRRTQAMLGDLAAVVGDLAGGGRGDGVVMVDDNTLGAERWATPFLERDGQWGGRPADDAAAIAELERLRAAGARFLAFAWPAFWWLEHYAGFRRHLRGRYRCAVDHDSLVVFDLGEPA